MGMDTLLTLSIFMGMGAVMVFAAMATGALARPQLPAKDKAESYECGELPVGNSWVQFDLRFYIVALFYLVFDVEVALTYPWAIVFREFPTEALVLGMPFILLIVLGFAYEWHTGALEWVRSTVNTSLASTTTNEKLSALARKDPV